MKSLMGRLGNEVRETIHHVTGLLDLVAEEPVSEGQLRYLERCRETVDRLLRAANDLAELERSEEVSVTSSPFNVVSAAGEIAELMGALATRKGLTFDYAVDGTIPACVIGDRKLLQDILRRVLDRAVRFTETGGIRLFVTSAEHGPGAVTVTFDIADTGPGIDDEALFSNLDSILSGIRLDGIGLMIVRDALAHLGGEMSVISNSDSGTTLRITMPAAIGAIDSTHMPVNRPGNTIASSQLKLLVAEDSEDSYLLFQSFVRAEGCQMTRAFNGAEAVQMAKSGVHNFIVMDVHMPLMDGYTATRLIREWETEQGRARLPILLISADDLATQTRIGASVGCSGYLPKPTTKAQVLTALSFYANPVGVPDLT